MPITQTTFIPKFKTSSLPTEKSKSITATFFFMFIISKPLALGKVPAVCLNSGVGQRLWTVLLKTSGCNVQNRPSRNFWAKAQASPAVKAPGCEPNDCQPPPPGPAPVVTRPMPLPTRSHGDAGSRASTCGAATRAGHPGRGLPPVAARAWRALRDSRHAAVPTARFVQLDANLSLIRNWNRISSDLTPISFFYLEIDEKSRR